MSVYLQRFGRNLQRKVSCSHHPCPPNCCIDIATSNCNVGLYMLFSFLSVYAGCSMSENTVLC